MRATVEVETSHRLFSAPKGGDNASSGPKKWAIQVDFALLSDCGSHLCNFVMFGFPLINSPYQCGFNT